MTPPTRYVREHGSGPDGGRPLWVRIYVYPVKDERDAVRAVVVLHVDITERQEAQQTLEQRVEERTRELASLLEVSRKLAATLELQPLLDEVFDQIKVVADFAGAAILLRYEDTFRLTYRRGPTELSAGDAPVFAIPVRRSERMAERLLNRQPVIVADIRADEPLAAAYREALGAPVEATHASYVRSWMGVPLALKDQVIGIIGLGHPEPGFYTPRHAELVGAIATHAAAAIENARLYGQVHQLAALEERQRLARELHDSVSQVLFSIGLGARSARTMLERNNVERAAATLENVVKLAEMGMAEMRALIFELRPESLAQEGLAAAITKQAAALRARHSIAVETALGEEPDVPLGIKEALYRIAQEATHNIVKHARAGRIDIRLTGDAGEVALDVEDNGLGFDPTGDFPGHLGLRSMRERVARFGGTVEIDSAPGRGTAIRVRIPVPSAS